MTAPSLFGDSDAPVEPVVDVETSGAPQTSVSDAFVPTSSLYRKYRPQSFSADEFVGQEPIVRTLRNAIALGRVAHAYLFSGPRGTGKTTTARLLAKAVNCIHEDAAQRPCNTCLNCQAINAGATSDVIEIDAASNRGIDDIRDLRERVRYAPAQLPSKVYIIDEAHQITGAAANAFLKTLEEPPSHTRFILATTDPEELLPTIVSRCQRFEFRRVAAEDVSRRVRSVADSEGIAIDDEAVQLIARHATGSLRDALGILEQLALHSSRSHDSGAVTPINAASVRDALGLSQNDRVEYIIESIAQRNAGSALRHVQDAIDQGEDARQLNRQLLNYLHRLLVERAGGATGQDDRVRQLASAFSLSELAALARRFGDIDFNIKHASFPQLPLEIALVEAIASPVTSEPTEPDNRVAPDVDPPSTPRPTSLRDRVRGAAIREVAPADLPRQNPPELRPITPLRPESTPEPNDPRSLSAAGGLAVDQIADLWPNVRADVKALNRRIEALLSEVDPVAVSGNQITLAVPYPFHRDKLNSDDVRDTVSGVLSRLLDRDISLVCVLRGELTGPGIVNNAVEKPETLADASANSSSPDDEERARIRLRAAINIFDAEEIVELPPGAEPVSTENG